MKKIILYTISLVVAATLSFGDFSGLANAQVISKIGSALCQKNGSCKDESQSVKKVSVYSNLDTSNYYRQMTNPINIRWSGGIDEVKVGIIFPELFNLPKPGASSVITKDNCLKDSDISSSLAAWVSKGSILTNSKNAGMIDWNGFNVYSRIGGEWPVRFIAIDPYYNFEKNTLKFLVISKNSSKNWKDENECYYNWDISDTIRVIHRDQIIVTNPKSKTISSHTIGDMINFSWQGGNHLASSLISIDSLPFNKDQALCISDPRVIGGTFTDSASLGSRTWDSSMYNKIENGRLTDSTSGKYETAIYSYADVYYENDIWTGLSDNNKCLYNWDVADPIMLNVPAPKSKAVELDGGDEKRINQIDDGFNDGKLGFSKAIDILKGSIPKSKNSSAENISFSSKPSSMPYKSLQEVYIPESEDKNGGSGEGVVIQPKGGVVPSTSSGQVPSASSGQVPSTSSGQALLKNNTNKNNLTDKNKVVIVPSASSGQVPLVTPSWKNAPQGNIVISSSEISKIQTQPQIQSNIPTSNNFPTQTNQGYKVTQSFQTPSFVQPLSSFQTTPSPSNLNIVSGYKVWAR